ncbi:Pancreatic triacylglycerol lipase [Aphis craccivora]|uniref:Pancreatic triacylglycerol lipase n=1 Tax=Aphis craccivora TaxID=307492 RepID=A0A6G0ZHD2_APHCR|nr:Pancreatic triacylglycerol lipase [Aphis craccivora]
MFERILSSFGRVQFFLLCLQLSHFVVAVVRIADRFSLLKW